jgi:hypothetical protein
VLKKFQASAKLTGNIAPAPAYTSRITVTFGLALFQNSNIFMLASVMMVRDVQLHLEAFRPSLTGWVSINFFLLLIVVRSLRSLPSFAREAPDRPAPL